MAQVATGDALDYLEQAMTASDEIVRQYMIERGVSTSKFHLDLVDEQVNLCIIKETKNAELDKHPNDIILRIGQVKV